MTSRAQLEKVLILNDRLMVGSNRPFRCLDLIDNSKYSPNEHLTLGKGLVPKYYKYIKKCYTYSTSGEDLVPKPPKQMETPTRRRS